jgi:tRNA-specific 2-thiouridylase
MTLEPSTPPVRAWSEGLDPARTTVVVGMSGGVDSSVTAALLKEQGFRVIGLFMKNWEEVDPATGVCTAEQDYADVARVCEALDIPYYSVNFAREYWNQVFSQFVEETQKGLTPNPDVLCNREIKFKVFYDQALRLGADFLATGHYCRIGRSPAGKPRLLKGDDPNKDQSYFLHAIDGGKLDRVLFPIGDLPKPEVRALARKYNLATQAKKDSTGICFIGEREFTEFLSRYVPGKPGDFVTLSGERVGRHRGAAYYTLGQRKGLGLGGQGEPWFVVGKNIEKNQVVVERGVDHPALFASELEAIEPTWISGSAPGPLPFNCHAKIRYRQGDQACTITAQEDGSLRVRFDVPQRAITPGQSVVFYHGEECLGGAVIRRAGPTIWESQTREDA